MPPPSLPMIGSDLKYFNALCTQIASNPSLTVKQEILKGFVSRYGGDLGLLFKLLLPKYNGRLYHLQDKQLIKLFAIALNVSEAQLKGDVNTSGCIASTCTKFFKPRVTSGATQDNGWVSQVVVKLEDLDKHLDSLSSVTTEDLQLQMIQRYLDVASKETLLLYLREIKQDLRLGAGIRVILAGLHPCANAIFKRCANIQEVVKRVLAGDVVEEEDGGGDNDEFDGVSDAASSPPRSMSPGGKRVTATQRLDAKISMNIPVASMLAAPSKGVEHVLAKCPNGAFSETKYDGERIQIHKDGTNFKFFSRSLKPMKADKYEGLQKYLVAAVKATSCILDGEILLVDLKTSSPLPFGTLGKHKKAQFVDACSCIFLFDILYKDGVTLLDDPVDRRREELKNSVDFIRNRVMISEMRLVTGTIDQRKQILQKHLNFALAEGLEGLVIKDIKSTYEPASRRWIKLKKDYLAGMADSADLIVLGANYGSGSKGGVLSTFLMGVWDRHVPVGGVKQFKTVCKVGNGHDDATLTKLNIKYKTSMVELDKPPTWLHVHSSHIPDRYIADPMNSDVWEIIGAEFSCTKTHTANGVSLRHPRVLKIRDDKDVHSATSLAELGRLVEVTKAKTGQQVLISDDDEEEEEDAVKIARAARNNGTTTAAAAAAAAAAASSSTPAARLLMASPARSPPPRLGSPQHGDTSPSSPSASHVDTAATTTASNVYHPRVTAATLTVPSPTTTATGPSDGGGGAKSLQIVTHEIAQPLTNPQNPHQDIIIAHCTSYKGKWSNRGTMGSLTKIYGEEPQEAYDERAGKTNLGEVIICEVSNRQSKGKIYIATMIGQSSCSRGQVPQVDHAALKTCIGKVLNFASKKNASFHLAKLDKITGVDWASIEEFIVTHPAAKNMFIRVYQREGALARTKTYAPPPGGVAGGGSSISSSLTRPIVPEGFHSLSSVTPCATMTMAQPPQLTTESSAMSRGDTDLFDRDFFRKAQVKVWIHQQGQEQGQQYSDRDVNVIAQKVKMLGGQVIVSPDQINSATHIISEHQNLPRLLLLGNDADHTNTHSGKGRVVACQRQWVDSCFEHNRHLKESDFHPPSTQHQSSLFKNCYIVLNGFDPRGGEDYSKLQHMIVSNGGVVQDTFRILNSNGDDGGHNKRKTTHMVTKVMDEVAKKAERLGGRVVTRSWIDESVKKKALEPVISHLHDENGDDDESTQQSAHERHHQHPRSPKSPVASSSPSASAQRHCQKNTPQKRSRTDDDDDDDYDYYGGGDRHQTSARPASSSSLFKGVVVAIDGYNAATTSEIANVIKAGGGLVVPHFTPSTCRFLICETLTAMSDGIHDKSLVLRKEWINACVEKRKLVMTKPYQFYSSSSSDTDDYDDEVNHPAPIPSRRQDILLSTHTAKKDQHGVLRDDASTTISDHGSATSTVVQDDAEDNHNAIPQKKTKEESLLLPPAALDGVLAIVISGGTGGTAEKKEMKRMLTAYGAETLNEIASLAFEEVPEHSHLYLVSASSRSDDENAVRNVLSKVASKGSLLGSAQGVTAAWVRTCAEQKKFIKPFGGYLLQKV